MGKGRGNTRPIPIFMNGIDTNGQEIGKTYRILIDLSFEKRLNAFDPNLKLVFDQTREKWVILEAAPNGTWNIVITADQPLGEWVFNELFVQRMRAESKRKMGADRWLDNLIYEAGREKQKIEANLSDNEQAKIREDLVQWRKGNRERKNLPVSDAIAGYPKV